MNLAVIGTGYVGLVAGTCFANTGNKVTCVDIDKKKVAQLKKGIPVIYEPGLDRLMERNIKEHRLFFTTDTKTAVEENDLIFIAVGTPPGEDGSADLQHVIAVARSIGQMMNSDKIVVNKSTVPVSTAEKVAATVKAELKKRNKKFKIDVISNPEFLKEGDAINDFAKPDRVILGGSSEAALDVMSELYSPFLRTSNRIFRMDNRSAELTKYASNAFLATKISFMNEIARLCDEVGADVDCVRVGVGADGRIGNKFLFPGVGYGGSCFPKDVKALVYTGQGEGVPMHVLKAVESLNDEQKKWVFKSLTEYYANTSQSLAGKKIGVWGLSFKPETDDMREAPSIQTINGLLNAGASVFAFDPVAMENAQGIWPSQVHFKNDAYEVLDKADALVIHTEWNEFRTPDFSVMKKAMNTPLIIDGRNLYDPQRMREQGFSYLSVGRPNVLL